ncbi:uncharacterized protein LOC116348064 isoform X2 [Contarinia nasturtii]|nr:uncharacterized protein LOC116348064 isoform X2 [Contarinia nasturtii]XP_031634784.1 uncharacterized protein LOC116348064 isoform X2 [Contarinia nasturtii]
MFTWKTIGKGLGCLLIPLCLFDITIQSIFFFDNIFDPIEFGIATLNLILCGLWMYGIAKSKIIYMSISLVSWFIQMIFIFTWIILTTDHLMKPKESLSSSVKVLNAYGAIVFMLIYFAFAVISFKKIREEIHIPPIPKLPILPRWNVITPQPRPRIKVKKYINLLDDQNCDKV